MKGKQKNRSPKMKKYLLIALLTSLSIQAEDNPFALKENLQKIDKDQDVLLSALKEMSDNQEAKEEALGAQEANENVVTAPNTEEVSQVEEVSTAEDMPEATAKGLMAKEVQNPTEQKQEISKHEVDAKTAEMVQQKKEEQAAIEAQKEQELAVKKEAQIQQEKALAQKEKERLEVEAYEKKRAAKKELEAKETVISSNAKMNSPADEAIADINIAREQMLSKKEADKAYLEAVAEMDKED